MINFEDRPDDGFIGKPPPITLAPGVTCTDILPAGEFYDFTTADQWGLNGCDAQAFSGIFMIGAYNNGNPVTMEITFSTPVARVDLYVGNWTPNPAIFEAYNAGGLSLGSVQKIGECPSLEADNLLSIDAGANTIARITIFGDSTPFIDDLTYWRFQ